MDNFVNWIMSHNTLLYSIFFGIMLIFACVLIVRYYVTNKSNLSAKQIVPLVITLVIFAYSFEQISWGHFYKVLSFNMFTFYCLLAYLYGDKINKRKVIDIAFWFLAISSVIMRIVGFIPGIREYIWLDDHKRFAGIVFNPNTLQFCTVIVLACILALFFKKHMGRLEMYCKAGTLVAIGLLTRSKTFMVILVILLAIYFVYEFTHFPKIAAIELVCLAALFGLVYLIWGHKIIAYLESRLYLYDGNSFLNGFTTGRWNLWGRYLGYWSEDTWALFFGKGMSSPDFIYGGTHNDLIFILYNLGIVGGILVLSLLVSYYIFSREKKKHFTIWNLLPSFTVFLVCLTENLLIRVFSLLVVFASLFIFDEEDYSKYKDKDFVVEFAKKVFKRKNKEEKITNDNEDLQ